MVVFPTQVLIVKFPRPQRQIETNHIHNPLTLKTYNFDYLKSKIVKELLHYILSKINYNHLNIKLFSISICLKGFFLLDSV